MRYLHLIRQTEALERHIDLLQWLQGDVQDYLSHDILLAGWGDFREGTVRHDILSNLPGARSYSDGTDSLPFLLGKFHDHWLAAGRMPCRLNFHEFDYLLGSASLPGSFTAALRGMRSALIHGLCDERNGQECLYVLLDTEDIPVEPASTALRVLMPSIDAALRRMTLLPQQRGGTSRPVRNLQEDVSGLSERETQIMAWVAMGKTNSEIGTILNISGFTVKNHMQRIFQKLNVFSRAQAVSKMKQVSLDG
ncbi:XrtB/PEP-CTERM-associated transcriptional regulator EpsA [Polaromonas sp.]|uniref:XrtB/PEP-CTERM-associated transcriptional regulator EpsA n=1 Tax=Polaromonas sp. TaxID=1869339 RepID=UPI003262ED80